MNIKGPGINNPILKIISIALEMWAKSKCQQIEDINIRINGSISEIMRGELASVKLIATKINFQDIYIQEIKLSSGKITIKSDNLLKRKIITSSNSFKLEGKLSFSETNINQIINSERWEWTNKWLSENLLNQSNDYSIFLEDKGLLIKSVNPKSKDVKEDNLNISISNNSLLFENKEKDLYQLLPMDPNIKFNSINLSRSKIEVYFNSLVNF